MKTHLRRITGYLLLVVLGTAFTSVTIRRHLPHAIREDGIELGLRLGEKVAFAEPAWQLPSPTPQPRQICFEAEGFSSYEDWTSAIRDWSSKRPALPNPIRAWEGLQVFKNERTFALEHFKSDKQMHCYIGCRIAQETDFTTAQFAAWEKERRDLVDCDGNSHFEDLDFTVTVWGAHLGIGVSSAAECISSCERSF